MVSHSLIVINSLSRYGVLPDSLKPNKKVKKLAKSESVSSEEDIDTEAKVMEEVKRKSLAEHQAMASQMDKENKEMEMAIAKSLVDQQRLQSEKKTQEDILEHQMKKLSMNEPTTSSAAGKIITLNTFLYSSTFH